MKSKNSWYLAALVFCLVLSGRAHAADVDISQLHLLPDPDPVVPGTFSKVPPPGVHPRILISPEDLPRIRDRVKNTVVAKWFFDGGEAWLQYALRDPDAPAKDVYDKLAAGDTGALDTFQDKWWVANIVGALSLEAYDALILQDDARGKKVAAALTTYVQVNQAKGTNATNNGDDQIAFAYDYAYGFMTDEQRAIVRATIAKMTTGQKTYGADMPSDWRTYNWMGAGTSLVLTALAIEGEDGYDTTIYPQSVQVMKDFLQYGIFTDGAPVEEMHYFHYGMGQGAMAMVAFAKRGDDLFQNEHYRNLVNWDVASMEPFGDAFSMHQDTPNDSGGVLANYVAMKAVWPNDPVLDLVWKNRVYAEARTDASRGDFMFASAYASDPKGIEPLGQSVGQKWGTHVLPKPDPIPGVNGIESLNLPLSYWSPERGYLITRDKWGSDGMVLDLDFNVSGEGGGHYHSNSGEFTLSALGRKWAIDRGFHVAESKDNSLVLIDGKGQGFFCVAGKTDEYREEPGLTVISGDASEPYHWMAFTKNRTHAPYLQGYTFEPDTYPDTIKRYAEVTPDHADRPWEDPKVDSGYVYRASWNPVQKAFRTAALRRGAHSYVLIVDDIRKDDQPHAYDWLMQVPDDLEVKSNDGADVVLGSADPKDNRRLLVRMVDIDTQGTGKWELENYEVKRTPVTGDNTSYGMHNRLKYTSQTVEPKFKVLLFPYREGDAVPKSGLQGTSLQVAWPDQSDSYQLSTLSDGRTGIKLDTSK